MKKNDDASLKNLLQKVELDSPSPNFTHNLMQQLETEASQASAFEPKLKALLQAHTLQSPSDNFTKKVLAQTAPPKTVYAPIISKKAWYGIAASVAWVLGIAILSSLKNTPSMPQITDLQRSYRLPNITLILSSVPSVYVMGIIAIATLLLADYLFRYRTLRIV